MTDLAAIKERHVDVLTTRTHMGGQGWCALDGQPWPCDVALLLADTPDVGPTHVSTPSVEPAGLERLRRIEAAAAPFARIPIALMDNPRVDESRKETRYSFAYWDATPPAAVIDHKWVTELRTALATPVTPEGGELHEHSMWECGRMKHIGSVHWLDESCSLPEDALDRCQFAPYRHTRLDLKPEAREFFGDVFMELTTTPGAALPTQASDSPDPKETR